MKLRDGSEVSDPRLDRLVQFDYRSLHFRAIDAIPQSRRETTVERRRWACDAFLDQGREGACVGFGVSHELAARPAAVRNLSDAFAQQLYEDAKKIDPWPGEDYSGTSVLAGVKVAYQRGYCTGYRWCFSVDEIITALAHSGPVIVGTNWYEAMYEPDEVNAMLEPSGPIVGGHCYLIRGFDLTGEPTFRIRNSWGLDWGRNGDAWIKISDYERSLLPDGEAVVFEGRQRVPAPLLSVPIAPRGGKGPEPPRPDSLQRPAPPPDETVADAAAKERQPVEV